MKRLFLLIAILAVFAVAEDVHDFSNLDAVRVPDGTSALPGLLLQSEGEDEPEGEQEGLYVSHEGEGEGDGVGVSVDSVSVGIFKNDGWNGNVDGDLIGNVTGNVTGDVLGDLTGNVTGNVTGDLTGEAIFDNGSVSDPSASFGDAEGEGESGFYNLAEGEDGIGVSVNQSSAGKIKSTGWNGNVVGNVTGNVTGNLTGDVTGGDITADSLEMNEGEGYIKPIDGTTANPGIIWEEGEGESDGIAHSSDSIDFIIDSTEVVTVESDGVHGDLTGDTAGTHTGAISLPDGTEGEPSDSYTNDPDTGRIRIGANEMGWVTGGTLRLRLSTSALTSTLPFLLPDGSEAAPSLSAANYSGTGVYFSNSPAVLFSTGGFQRGGFDSAGMISNLGYQPVAALSTTCYRLDYSTDTGIGGNSTSITRRIGGVEYENFQAASETRLYSGGEFSRTLTNYYTGANHNKLLLRATRGTSASPDYLDDGDILGRLKFEARDGAGTWGDGAEMRVVADDDHGSGDTYSKLEIYTTPDSTDTQVLTASFGAYTYYPGLLDIVVPYIGGRVLWPADFGSDCSFGYMTDVLNEFGLSVPDGVQVFDFNNVNPCRLAFGNDDNIYFGGDGTNATGDDTWRFGRISGTDTIGISQYDSSGTSWDDVIHFDADGIHGDLTGDVTGDTDGTHTGEVVAPNGSASDPSVSFGDSEGEGESGFYNLAEGEDGIGVSVKQSSVGKIKSTGWNGNVVGNVTGNVTGDLTGDVTGGDIAADSVEMNEGEGYIKPIDGTTANPAIIWEEGEGESDGIAHSSDSIDFVIDSTEVVTVEADGIHYDVTIYDSKETCSLSFVTGGTLPGLTSLLDKDGDDTGIDVREWDIGEEGSGSLCIPRWYDSGTNIYVATRIGSNDAPSGTDYIKLQLIYVIVGDEETIPDAQSVYVEVAYDTQYENVNAVFGTISGTGVSPGDTIYFTLKRIAASGDAFAGEAYLPGLRWIFKKENEGLTTLPS